MRSEGTGAASLAADGNCRADRAGGRDRPHILDDCQQGAVLLRDVVVTGDEIIVTVAGDGFEGNLQGEL
jgi:hypothetical protein